MLISLESEKSVEEVSKTVEEKAKEYGFGVLSVHEVSKILEGKGKPIDYSCVIVEICQPSSAQKVLSKNPFIATALPCRIAIFNKEKKTIVSTIAPTNMLEMFSEPDLEPVAKEVEETIRRIMEESL